MPRVVLSGLAAICLAAPAAAKEPAPYRASLDVRWGEGAGSDAFLDDLTRSVAAKLATRCFQSVAIAGNQGAPEDRELAVRVILSDVFDETRFDDSIAAVLQPGEPTQELRRVAQFSMAIDATLSTAESGTLIVQKHFAINAARRPVFIGEDPQEFARAQAIEDAGSELARAFGCGGARLTRKIRDALSAQGSPASPAR